MGQLAVLVERRSCEDILPDRRQTVGWLLPLIQREQQSRFPGVPGKGFSPSNLKQAKAVFKKMRLLQKSIEDTYNDSISYNYIGVIMYIRNSSEERFAFLRWYFNLNSRETTVTPGLS